MTDAEKCAVLTTGIVEMMDQYRQERYTTRFDTVAAHIYDQLQDLLASVSDEWSCPCGATAINTGSEPCVFCGGYTTGQTPATAGEGER